MYCYVIFRESDDNHTRRYLYECAKDIEIGDVVFVPTKNITKIALVQEVVEAIPTGLNIEIGEIKSVITKNEGVVNAKQIRSFLLALIDEYKDGIIVKEELYGIMEHLVSTSVICKDGDEILDCIISTQLPDACLYYIDEPGNKDDKELGFWKELKDIEYRLKYGYSFWEKPKHGFHDIEEDPIEYTDRYLRIELELERLIRNEIGEGGYMGFCHKYWCTKKRILKEKFGIKWESPVDLNPMVNFD